MTTNANEFQHARYFVICFVLMLISGALGYLVPFPLNFALVAGAASTFLGWLFWP